MENDAILENREPRFDIKAPLDKGQLGSVIEEIVEPFYQKILTDPFISSVIPSDEMLYRLKTKQSVLVIRFITDDLHAIGELLLHAAQIHKHIDMRPEFFIDYYFFWADLLIAWIKKHLHPNEQALFLWNNKLLRCFAMMARNMVSHDEFESHFIKTRTSPAFEHPKSVPLPSGPPDTKDASAASEPEGEPEPVPYFESDVPFESFDDAPSPESVSTDVPVDHVVIAAADYMADTDIDKEMLDELEELEKDVMEVLYVNETLTDGILKQVYVLFHQYSVVLNNLIEFKDLGYAISSLANLMMNTLCAEMEEMQKKQLYIFFDSVVKDLGKWRNEIFIDQSAIDIHYLDASLLSSIAQLEVMLSGCSTRGSSIEIEDDIEFF